MISLVIKHLWRSFFSSLFAANSPRAGVVNQKNRSKMPVFKFLGLVLLFFSSCCRLEMGDGGVIREGSTISIPFIKGDELGDFTRVLCYEMTSHHRLCLIGGGGDYELKVSLCSPKDRNIGYVFAPQRGDRTNPTSRFTHSNIVIPNQGRMTLTAKVELVECVSGCRVFGPQDISTFLDYDFNPDITKVNENAFSLGQLEQNEMAKDGARDSLYNLLAQKIVSILDSAW